MHLDMWHVSPLGRNMMGLHLRRRTHGGKVTLFFLLNLFGWRISSRTVQYLTS